MNSGNCTLIQTNCQWELQPELEWEFADFLINQLLDAAFCLGEDAQFLYVNKAFCHLTEYSREELLLMKLHNLDVDCSLHDWSEQWQSLRSQHHLCFKSRYRTKNGRIFLAEINITYVNYKNQEFACAFVQEINDIAIDLSVKKWVGECQQVEDFVQQDISPSKNKELELQQALEQERKLSELRAHFVAMLCHQIRSPLNIVSFSNSMLQRHLDEWKGDKVQPLLENIQTAVEKLSQMLEDILFLAKTEAEKINFEPNPLDLLQFCQDFLAKMPMTYHSSINFINQIYHLTVWIDKKLVEIILQNLLDNAIKYSPIGNVVDLILNYEDGNIIFHVQDRGFGIPETDQKRLFEAFYRGSNVDHIPGTGLGLSIVKTLVELHKGEIKLVSEVGMGTTVTVKLPSIRLQSTTAGNREQEG
ncbi:MAG TPA: ATP-binding protein [Nostocaceae cyanobacterium]|nr:ATP-binding protein [Nostocaceae cyanobacterium]